MTTKKVKTPVKKAVSRKPKTNVKDITFWGNENTWKLIYKESSQKDCIIKSTQAMEIEKVGCLVKVECNNMVQGMTFIPDATIIEKKDRKGNVVERKLVSGSYPHLLTQFTKKIKK